MTNFTHNIYIIHMGIHHLHISYIQRLFHVYFEDRKTTFIFPQVLASCFFSTTSQVWWVPFTLFTLHPKHRDECVTTIDRTYLPTPRELTNASKTEPFYKEMNNLPSINFRRIFLRFQGGNILRGATPDAIEKNLSKSSC